ncbi:asparagine synthetase B [Pontibacter sp. SGAir0037]|uniref:asparagine synthetase B n=1 Tax=Pontibacter sp. SGAir0037 TaxID=2571030 RepID=UPI0010CCF327|nr:asparagine synthetase B [Pontibacter sp. SGAir0037]QCR22134.1 asparagine synthetase B [Pontibacter sp. SGAir0037]
MLLKSIPLFICTFLLAFTGWASTILVPMDESQKDHLKSYGVAYWVLSRELPVDWLLNYRGGAFAFQHVPQVENELIVRGVSYQVISDAQYNTILNQISDPEANMDIMKLEKLPKVAVYSPKSKMPWDDAVTLVLTYAEIPYDIIYDDEIMAGDLPKYDWLHLHHEDFTGQYGKFYASYRHYPWYQEQQREAEASAQKHGFAKVSQLKLSVVKKIKDFCAGGGFLFAMCSATDTYDIALAADGVDFIEAMYDGDGADPNAQEKFDYTKTFAFKDFRIVRNPLEYEYSNIDMQPQERNVSEANDFFQLFTFSAKWDPLPTMLTQNHAKTIKGFMGQTTAFRKSTVKPDVTVMGENKELGEIRYMHGTFARGTWTFYGGHDPEDYQHLVGEDPTDLALHPNSPGYRLILNNILFPAAKKKKQKT